MSYAKPLPRLDALTTPFWEATKQRRLVLQHCPACGDTRFPPGPVCPRCLADGQSWIEACGRGTLESWVDMHRAYWDGFKDGLPYRVCLVRLEEGPLLVSNLVGETGDLRLGASVAVIYEDVTDAVTLPKFRLA